MVTTGWFGVFRNIHISDTQSILGIWPAANGTQWPVLNMDLDNYPLAFDGLKLVISDTLYMSSTCTYHGRFTSYTTNFVVLLAKPHHGTMPPVPHHQLERFGAPQWKQPNDYSPSVWPVTHHSKFTMTQWLSINLRQQWDQTFRTITRFQPSLAISNHQQPMFTMMKQYLPSMTMINNHQPLPNIKNQVSQWSFGLRIRTSMMIGH